MITSPEQPCINTDKELFRERQGDYYSDSLHVTEHGGIGINCGGLVIVKPLKQWHALANNMTTTQDMILVMEAILQIASNRYQGHTSTETEMALNNRIRALRTEPFVDVNQQVKECLQPDPLTGVRPIDNIPMQCPGCGTKPTYLGCDDCGVWAETGERWSHFCHAVEERKVAK